MAADEDPPPPNPFVQRAAQYQALASSGLDRLVAREDRLVLRLLELAEQEDNLPVALNATRDALDRIRDRHAWLDGRSDEDRPLTPDEEREAEEIAERLRAKKR